MARLKSPMQALMLQILQEMIAGGVITNLLGTFAGGDKAAKEKEQVKIALHKVMALVVAALLFVVAVGFLVGAAYLQLAMLYTPPLAALLTAAGLLLLAACAFFLGKPQAKERQPRAAAEKPGPAGLSLVQGLFDFAKKNMDVIAILIFLVGIWLSVGDEDKSKNKSE